MQTLMSTVLIRNMCVMFPSFRCGVLQTRDGNQISTPRQCSRLPGMSMSRKPSTADLRVTYRYFVGVVLLQCSRVAGPDGG